MATLDPDLALEFEAVRDSGETLLWAGKPHYAPYLATAAPMLIFGLLWGAFDLGFLFMAHAAKAPMGLKVMMIPFFAIHAFPAWGSILYVLYLAASYKNAAYAITNRRVVLRGGLWAPNFKSFDMDQIAEVDVEVGPLEKLLGCGSVRINTGRTSSKGATLYDSFVAVDEPYEVYKLLKTTEVDIKTDWNYPNKLRPSDNPGYRTEYRPDGPRS